MVTAGDGRTALAIARREKPDLVLLDLNLPGVDGLEVCRTLRKESGVPIIMLTARGDEGDKLIGLELGADDYITKPFSPREVVARVRAVLRRSRGEPAQPEQLSIGALLIDQPRHEVRCHGTPVALTPTEFDLLLTLAQNPGRVYTRLQLLDRVQGMAYEGYERTVDVHIKNLRQKLEAVAGEGACRIATIYGVGYKFEPDRNEHADS
jgi:DNA-binding response OmpR family regulator